MKYSVIPADNKIVAGGVARDVNLAGLVPADVHAIQWDNTAKKGHIEFNDGTPNEMITSLARFDDLVAAFQAAEPPPPPPPPPPPTDEEIDDESIDRLSQAGSIERALGEALFTLANDMRVLKGQETITKAQFVTYLRGLLR